MRTILLLLLTIPAFCAISANTAFEVRPTVGSAVAGGGFVAGATGTDMSLFDNKNAASCTSCQSATVNISTTDAVAAGTTTITSATANFSAAIVGNIVYFTGGTGSIAAVRRQVATFTNSTTIVLDASIAASTGMTMNIGGALDSPATALLANTTSNKIFVKNSGTLTLTTSLTLNNGLSAPSSAVPTNMLTGYHATRGDCSSPATCAGRPTLQWSGAGSNVIASASGWWIENFNIDCASMSNSVGILLSTYNEAYNNKISHCVTGIQLNGNYATVSDNEVTTGVLAGTGILFGQNTMGAAIRNVVHDGASGVGISARINSLVDNNLIYNLSGSGTTGIGGITGGVTDQYALSISHNTVYNVTGACIQLNGGSNFTSTAVHIRNNLLSTCGTYGIDFANNAGAAARPIFDGNAFHACTTANRHFMDDTTTNPINGVAPYTNVLDVSLSASPFTNAAGGDFTLNNTAGGGAAVRGTGTPGAMLGISQTGFQSFGALQPNPAGAGGGAFAFVQ